MFTYYVGVGGYELIINGYYVINVTALTIFEVWLVCIWPSGVRVFAISWADILDDKVAGQEYREEVELLLVAIEDSMFAIDVDRKFRS